MKTVGAMVVAATLASGCGVVHVVERLSSGKAQVQGSGKAARDVRKVADFNVIVVEGAYNVEARVGPEVSVTLHGDDNIVSLITTKVEGGKLVVSCEESYSTKTPVRLVITAPSLEGIEVRGSSNALLEGVDAKRFAASIAGSGDVTVQGTADQVDASIAGSGDLDLAGLKAKSADVSVSGSGDVAIFASESLDATIAGSGDIAYSGNPAKVSRSVVGSGEVHPAG